jgi:hypothetical protein
MSGDPDIIADMCPAHAVYDRERIDAAVVTDTDVTAMCQEHGERMYLTPLAHGYRAAIANANDAAHRNPRGRVYPNRFTKETDREHNHTAGRQHPG